MEKINNKLSKQNFRYLDETEIASPLHYLHDFYVDKIDFATWRSHVTHFLLARLDGRPRRNGLEYGYISQRLIKHIETAYVIYKQSNIKSHTAYKRHLGKIRERRKHYISFSSTNHSKNG